METAVVSSQGDVITDELRSLLNVQFGPKHFLIEKWMLERFADAIGDDNPLWQEVAPPTFVCILRLEDLLESVWGAPCPLKTKLNAGNDLRYYHPIRLGDSISVTGSLVDLQQREGKSGPMVIMRVQLCYMNQRGELAVELRRTMIRK